MKKGYIKGFTQGKIIICSKNKQRRGYVPGDPVKIIINGYVKEIAENMDMSIIPVMEQKYIAIEYDRKKPIIGIKKKNLVFQFLYEYKEEFHELGYYDVDEDIYPHFKVYIQQTKKPLFKMFEHSETFSIKEVHDEEFDELLNIIGEFIGVEMGFDAARFWMKYQEYKELQKIWNTK